jgi:hypothetical protein
MARAVADIAESNLTDEQKRSILSGNAIRYRLGPPGSVGVEKSSS